MRRIIASMWALAALVPIAALAGGGGGGGDTNYATCAQRDEDGTTVLMRKNCFEPAFLRVPVGATVTFASHDSSPHTVTSSDGSEALDLRFDRGDLSLVRFAQAGRYAFVCSFHPGMSGEVRVGSATVRGAASGVTVVRAPDDPQGTSTDGALVTFGSDDAPATGATSRSALPWALAAIPLLAGLAWVAVRKRRAPPA